MESQTDSLLVLAAYKPYRVLNAAKPGHSTDPVSAVTQKGKTLLGVKHGIEIPIVSVNFHLRSK